MSRVSKLVLDAGPLINLTREEIVARGEKLFATPAVIREIRDENARRRLELMKGEITVQQPSADAVKHVTDFAKLTGDGVVLSTQDIEVIALAYDLTDDKTHLRARPSVTEPGKVIVHEADRIPAGARDTEEDSPLDGEQAEPKESAADTDADGFTVVKPKQRKKPTRRRPSPPPAAAPALEPVSAAGNDDSESDWSDDGWINPTNLQKTMDTANQGAAELDEDLEVAVATRDFAVQNTAMQMGIAAVNERGLRIKKLRSYMQRCYACFKLIPLDTGSAAPRQFCPQCGGHTLTRVTTSIDKKGRVHVHLKAKMQWITRGDRYALPNPQSRRARRQQHDTKKEFYAEDQPEYQKAVKRQQWQQRRNEKAVAEYVGPTTVDSAVSPFALKREPTAKVHIGRGRYANETGRKSELDNPR